MHPKSNLPKVLFVGYGRAGKDEAASYLSTISPLRYAGSFSWAGLPHMAKFLSLHPQVAWETRHQRRQEWKDELDRLRLVDQCFLARRVLEQGEVTAGLRDRLEIDAVKAERLFDHIVWIERPGILIDPTVTFTRDDATALIINDGSLSDFHAKIRRWARVAGIPLNIAEL